LRGGWGCGLASHRRAFGRFAPPGRASWGHDLALQVIEEGLDPAAFADRLVARIALPHQLAIGRVVDDQALATQRVLEQLVIARGRAPNVDFFAQNQPFGHYQLLFVDGHDEHIAFLMGSYALAYRLADRNVLDLYFVAQRFDFEPARNFFDFG